MNKISTLGAMGVDTDGRRTRLAASDKDKAGMELVARWMRDVELKVLVDRIGNLLGIWEIQENQKKKPLMLGSHINTVLNAGQYDECYGVIAGIEVIRAMKGEGIVPSRPIVVVAFTNEAGIRYAPDMMGSLVYTGGMDVDEAFVAMGTDSTVMGEELKRTGYGGAAFGAIIDILKEQPEIKRQFGVDGNSVALCFSIEGVTAIENYRNIVWMGLLYKEKKPNKLLLKQSEIFKSRASDSPIKERDVPDSVSFLCQGRYSISYAYSINRSK